MEHHEAYRLIEYSRGPGLRRVSSTVQRIVFGSGQPLLVCLCSLKKFTGVLALVWENRSLGWGMYHKNKKQGTLRSKRGRGRRQLKTRFARDTRRKAPDLEGKALSVPSLPPPGGHFLIECRKSPTVPTALNSPGSSPSTTSAGSSSSLPTRFTRKFMSDLLTSAEHPGYRRT